MGSTGIEPGGTQSHPVSHPLEQLFYPLSESFPSKSSASPQAHSMVICPQQCLMHVQILGGTQLRPKLESWQPVLILFFTTCPSGLCCQNLADDVLARPVTGLWRDDLWPWPIGIYLRLLNPNRRQSFLSVENELKSPSQNIPSTYNA